MRRGVRLAVDVGSVRVGVARSDVDGVLAVPLETVPRGDGDVSRIRHLVDEWAVTEVLVGLPRRLAGDEGPAAASARAFAAVLAAAVDVPVRLVDERLSTVSANADLRAAGRTSRSSRAVVDQAAAVVFLQSALERERSTGGAPGELVPAGEPR